MENTQHLIKGSEKITNIFGYWPIFHDAEILELNFDRGDVRPAHGIYKFPILTLKIHLWEMTKEVNEAGYFVLRHHTLATLCFTDVSEFQMQGFNHQNAVMSLTIRSERKTRRNLPCFEVKIESAFGMGAEFECFCIEVLAALPCDEEGQTI